MALTLRVTTLFSSGGRGLLKTKMASVVTVIIEPCHHNDMTRRRLFASVPDNKSFNELLEDYHGFPTIDCRIEAAQEENSCWTLLPVENTNLTLQSLASFNIRYLKISCTVKQQEPATNQLYQETKPTKDAFTVLMSREHGMPQKRKCR